MIVHCINKPLLENIENKHVYMFTIYYSKRKLP